MVAGRNNGRFTKGNPGRPKGARGKATMAAQALLDGEAQALTRIAIERAKGGDAVALRLCLDRIVPPAKDRPIAFELPKIATAADAARAQAAILAAVASGEITPSEAEQVARLIEGFVKTLEASEFERRLADLEAQAKGGGAA